ncbi:MAG: endonuclease III domain-containing protein [Acidobacteriota bacterium]
MKRRTEAARARSARAGAKDARRQALRLIHERLTDAYGSPSPNSRKPPLDEVVFTILSQNTTDSNRDRAWAGLWDRFDNWGSVARAPASRIASAIQSGGLQQVKARRIKELLRQVKQERGSYDLDNLRALEMPEVRRRLSRYKGLGAKSINCVLLFSLGRPAFPVDTHVHRVLRRIGVLETADLSRANREIQEEAPARLAYPLHMNVIRHGREVCTARRPRCDSCVLEDLCGYSDK